MHAQVIDTALGHKMYTAGFRTVRISLESSDVMQQKFTGPKITNNGFTRAVERLKAAGFMAQDIGVYPMMGLPGQPLEEVIESIHFVHNQGVPVKFVEFTSSLAPSNGSERVRFMNLIRIQIRYCTMTVSLE